MKNKKILITFKYNKPIELVWNYYRKIMEFHNCTLSGNSVFTYTYTDEMFTELLHSEDKYDTFKKHLKILYDENNKHTL